MSSILLIGEASTTYGINKIIKQSSEKLVKNFYGENSELTQAFLIALSYGVEDIYLANVKTNTSSIDVMQAAKQYNFTYIVPINVRFSDRVRNKELNRTLTYTEAYLRIITSYTDSIIVMTDNYADLYEDIDHYLNDMFNKIHIFKTEANSILEDGRQLWFVANNLKDCKMANVILASIMCVNPLPYYPNSDLPEAIFDIDLIDIKSNELIYFKNNIHTNTTIENFINFHNEDNAYKIALIDMVIRELNNGLDLSYFYGKLLNNQIKLKLKSYLQNYLNSQKGKLIRDYEILSIDSYLTTGHYYIIVNRFKILPMNSLEEVEVIIEV